MTQENPMSQVVNMVSQRTGLGKDQAETAVRTVLDFLKQRLPAPIAGQIDNVLSGSGGGLDDIAGGLGGMLGGRK